MLKFNRNLRNIILYFRCARYKNKNVISSFGVENRGEKFYPRFWPQTTDFYCVPVQRSSSSDAPMTGSSRISHRERIYVRHATLLNIRADKKVNQAALINTLLAANNGDNNAVIVRKISAAVDTRKYGYSQPSNSYIFHSVCLRGSFSARIAVAYSTFIFGSYRTRDRI